MIKLLPEDFVVEEKAKLPLAECGEFRVYLLRKESWNTPDLIRYLSHVLPLPLEKFSYGGKKDKHGVTSQFITIRAPQDYSRRGKKFSLESVGFMDRPMGPEMILGNFFRITLRRLQRLEPLERNVEEVRRDGFPNFYDDQRFRSYDPSRGFFAEKILKRHWNGALKVFLTSGSPGMRAEPRERKEALFRNWKDWTTCLILAREREEQTILKFLQKHPQDFKEALVLLAEEEVSMRYSAFQSHLWNELLRRVLGIKLKGYVDVKGSEGPFRFWKSIDGETSAYLKALEIPTAAATMTFQDEYTLSLYEEILKEKDLTRGAFRTRVLSRVYFKSFPRKAVVVPESLLIHETGNDEFYEGQKKAVISFFLPRGSYGTMLVKRLSLSPSAIPPV